MDKFIFQGKTQAERIQILRDNAYKISEETYYKNLTEDELSERKDLYSSKAIDVNKLENDLKDLKDEYSAEIKPLKKEMSGILLEVKMQSQQVTEEVYQIADYDENYMGTYNAEGELISQRPLRKDERQLRMNLKQA